MKMMAGAASRACLNRSRTRLAPTPTIISTNSLAPMLKNGTLASPATARASSVLPVPRRADQQHALAARRRPGGCTSSGSFRKSTISTSSSLASSMPATSANVTFAVVSVWS